jgi:Ni/Co efflux regulator RcnB
MKLALALILSTTLLAGTAAMAQDYRRDAPPPERFQERSDRGEHAWVRGERVPVELRDRGHVVSDYRAYHLRRPPVGYVWVRDRDRFLLVGKKTGRIAELAQAR